MFMTSHHTKFKTTNFNSQNKGYNTHTAVIYKSESCHSSFWNPKLGSTNVSPDS
jgi:hypothetical protein